MSGGNKYKTWMRVVINTNTAKGISAWLDVRDHGFDLRFFERKSRKEISADGVIDWDLDKAPMKKSRERK